MRIYIECSHTYTYGQNTGVQRVVRNFVAHGMRLAGPLGVEVLPVVFLQGRFLQIQGLEDHRFRPRRPLREILDAAYLTIVRAIARWIPSDRARRFLLAHRSEFGLARLLYWPIAFAERRRLPKPDVAVRAAVAAPASTLPIDSGDVLFLADSSWGLMEWGPIQELRSRGVRVVALLYDIIPLTHPEVVGPHLRSVFEAWLGRVLQNVDGLVCISDSTRQALVAHSRSTRDGALPACEVVHLGHDLVAQSTDAVANKRLRAILQNPDPLFVCVGTLEPRKNHAVLLDAFERCWQDGSRSRLLLIGKAGALGEALITRIRRHAEHRRRLFWLNDVGDADLDHAYRGARAIILPSLLEGFGLPVVEGLSRGRPVFASDIPVFREIADGFADFFDPHDAAQLAALVRREELAPRATPRPFPWPSWSEATRDLLTKLRAPRP